NENQERIKALAKTTGTPLLAAHDVYYLEPSDRVARETMVKIQNGGVVDTSGDLDDAEDFSFLSQAEMKERMKDVPEAIENTVKVAEMCNVEIPLGTKWYFPDYIIESGKEPDDELRDLAYKGVP